MSRRVSLRRRRGVGDGEGLPCRGTRAGREGDGGGEARRWLNEKREEVAERGPESPRGLRGPLRRKCIRGAPLEGARSMLARVGESVRSRWFGMGELVAAYGYQWRGEGCRYDMVDLALAVVSDSGVVAAKKAW